MVFMDCIYLFPNSKAESMKNNRLSFPFSPTGRRKMNRLLLCLGVCSCTFLSLTAQNTVFDPLLDTSCKILPIEKSTSWNSSYMWYPGQLGTHLQRMQKENGYLLVDFHYLEVGSAILQACGSGRISFSVGESPEEALNGDVGSFEQKAVKTYVLTDKLQEIRLPERALRYLKISCTHPCTVVSIRCDAKMWPVEFQMQFESDNKALNNLWEAGVATLHTSIHNFYLDGVKRDYLPWSMDTR